MEHKEYIAISKDVAEKLSNHFEKFCKKNPAFSLISKEYTQKRIHLNGIQFYAGFKAANSKEDFAKFFNIPIAIECIMLAAYKTNRILDHKQEVWSSEQKIKETVLGEKIYLSLIFALLEDSKENLGEKYPVVQDLIIDLISKIYQGFWYEQNDLNVNFSPQKEILKNWSSKYKKRNILFNGVYDYSSLIGFYIGSGDNSVFKKFENYFKNKDKMSHSAQVVNDVSDYSSVYDENVKSYQDAFSDIRNGIITQPTFELIKDKVILDALKNPQLTKDVSWRKKVINILIKKNVVAKIKKETEKSYAQNINFWKKIMKVDSELLFNTYSILSRNKYYHEFLNYKK
jgi:hypothetical protein